MALLLDTHALIWYLLDSPRLSSDARLHIASTERNAESLFVSAISLVEIIYLCERDRLPAEAWQKLEYALNKLYSSIVVAALDHQVATHVQKIPRAVVPEMPDRIIAATALYLKVPLVTRDRELQKSGILTIW